MLLGKWRASILLALNRLEAGAPNQANNGEEDCPSCGLVRQDGIYPGCYHLPCLKAVIPEPNLCFMSVGLAG